MRVDDQRIKKSLPIQSSQGVKRDGRKDSSALHHTPSLLYPFIATSGVADSGYESGVA
jgi:hypothetical protein